MDFLCPKGHHSTDADYCSECGAKIQGAPSALTNVQPAPPSTAVSGDADVCPDCGTRRANATATFCEVCRYNFATHASWSVTAVRDSAPPVAAAPMTAAFAPSMPAGTATALAFDAAADPATLSSPPAPTDLTPDTPASLPTIAPLSAKWEAVVRVDPTLYVDPDPGVPCPTDEPERVYHLDFAENLIGRRSDSRDIHPEINLRDPGVSHRHAKLLRQPDGSVFLLDVGSTNGTLLNGASVPEGVKTPIKDNDAITLGFWTRITLRETRI